MKELFGIPMTNIMIVLLIALGLCLAVVALIVIFNPTMAKLGLRNIPRRRAQSLLVVLGLMLSTLIIAAAFTVGDSLDYSITRDVYSILGPVDEEIEMQGGAVDAESSSPYVPIGLVTSLESQFQGDADIEAFLPAIIERVPVFNPATRQSGPRMILTGVDPQRVAKVGGLRDTDGKPIDLAGLPARSLLLNPKSADILEAGLGDTLLLIVNNRPLEFTVAGVAQPELLTGWQESGPGTRDEGGVTVPLAVAQDLLNKPGQINFIGVSNTGGIRDGLKRTDAVAAKLEPLFADEADRRALGLGEVSVKVEKSKQEGVETAETFGNIFTTFFLVLGLFSIAAGILLIFMIFVMLAAERKTEMGMARAVGLKRRNLIQSFIAEGMVYDLASGLIGAALGVLAAFLLVVIATRFLFGDSFTMDLRVTPRSLVISYALGVVLTFITVAISSWRVSKLNIVAAIRDIADVKSKRAGKGSLIWGIVGTVLAVVLLLLGKGAESAFPFSAGITIGILSAALILRFFGLGARLVFSVAGALIFIYWSLPFSWSEKLFGKLEGDFEMFFLSGIGMVIGTTLLLVFNATVLTNLFQSGHRGSWTVPGLMLALLVALVIAGRALEGEAEDVSQLLYMGAGLAGLLFVVALVGNQAERFAPALKMAIAYPLSNRFRTGMTIAMFSLIVFSITVLSTLTDNFSKLFVADTARAGWNLTAIVNRNNPLQDFRTALAKGGFSNPEQITAVGRSTFPGGSQQARVAGTEKWKDFPLLAADDGFFQNIQAKMNARARGYDSDAAVWEAVRTQPNLAVVDATVLQSGLGDDPDAFRLAKQIEANDLAFDPVQIEVRDEVSNKVLPLTVIGVTDQRVSPAVVFGLYTSIPTYQSIFGAAQTNRLYIRLAPGVDPKTANREVKAALATRGVESFDLEAELKDQQKLQVGFNQIFQGFMALGLFVGVAALGVIAFRSVVERRQQIGMLRAIGYQKGTVALSFILESAFISVMGVLAGIIGATILARNLWHSDEFGDLATIPFTIPWLTVVGFLVAGFGFALLMTWWPARQASSVPIAEALRYE